MKKFVNRFLSKTMWPLVGVMALTLIDGQAIGQSELVKLLASDGAMDDQFGFSVSITGDLGNEVAITGAWGDADNGSNTGSAYIYRKSGGCWVEEAKLLASDGGFSDRFGFSVSITGTPGNEVAIVGAWGDANVVGSAYIYRFNGVTWDEEQKLLASDGEAFDRFGHSVSISGASGNEVAIVGAWIDDDNGSGSGSAYIYRFNGVNWDEEQKLIASDGAEFDFFGWSVSITGAFENEIAIVGAYGDGGSLVEIGSAYIYRFNGVIWDEEQKLIASDGAPGDEFGRSVSITGDSGNEAAIVGAHLDDDNSSGSGSAYIYRKSGATWVEETKLLASDGAANDNFGQTVSITGATGNEAAIVGAHQDDDNGSKSGSAYIYRFNGVTWDEEQKLIASDGASNEEFGISVSISGDSGNEAAIVGAHQDDDNGSNSGSSYILTGLRVSGLSGDCNSNGINDLHDLFLNKTSADCNDNGIPDECDIASGVSVDDDVDGIPDECLASCPADNTGDGNVNVTDLLALLAAWGVCP